jgi:hypothetical protein
MFDILPQSAGKVLGIRASGELTDDDYKNVFIPALKALLDEHDRLRLLVWFDTDFEGWTPRAMWDDAHFGVVHRNDFERVAVVGAPTWIEWGVRLNAHFMSAQVRTFPAPELEQAWDWLRSQPDGRPGR